ncbi:hypothetical protein Ahia01_001157500, partial [Argonauta hians]
MANFLNKDRFTYNQEYTDFLKELKLYHTNRGTPFQKLPQIAGRDVDLYHLYRRVISYGGWQKVNEEQNWDELFDEFNIPKGCTNGIQAIKQIYIRFLNEYEKIHFLGEDPAHEILDDDEDGSARKKCSTPLHNVPLTYKYSQHKVSEHARQNAGLSCQFVTFSDYDKLEMALMSGLPNEVDFVVNVCTLLSNDGKRSLRLDKSKHLLDLLLAHIGIFSFGDTSLEELYEKGWRPFSKRNFVKFWYDTVYDKEVREMISDTRDGTLIREWVGEEVLNLGRSLGVTDVEGQRVTQMAIIVRNLSFDEENLPILANNRSVFRFLLLCAYSKYGSLRQIGLDTLGNSALQMILESVDHPDTQLILRLISKCLCSSDKCEVVRGLEILSKLCQVEENEGLLSEHLESKAYEDICKLLTIHDIQVIIYTLETLYQLSELGEATSGAISSVKHAVDTLVQLVTVEAQSYGPNSLIGIKVVEFVPHQTQQSGLTAIGPPVPPQPPPPIAITCKTVPQSNSIPTTEIETTCNWLRANLELKDGCYMSHLSLYTDYLSFCKKFSLPNPLNSSVLHTCVKAVFPNVEEKIIERKDGNKDIQFSGFSKRAAPLPFAITWQVDKTSIHPSSISSPYSYSSSSSYTTSSSSSATQHGFQKFPQSHTPTLRQRLLEPPMLHLQAESPLPSPGVHSSGQPPAAATGHHSSSPASTPAKGAAQQKHCAKILQQSPSSRSLANPLAPSTPPSAGLVGRTLVVAAAPTSPAATPVSLQCKTAAVSVLQQQLRSPVTQQQQQQQQVIKMQDPASGSFAPQPTPTATSVTTAATPPPGHQSPSSYPCIQHALHMETAEATPPKQQQQQQPGKQQGALTPQQTPTKVTLFQDVSGSAASPTGRQPSETNLIKTLLAKKLNQNRGGSGGVSGGTQSPSPQFPSSADNNNNNNANTALTAPHPVTISASAAPPSPARSDAAMSQDGFPTLETTTTTPGSTATTPTKQDGSKQKPNVVRAVTVPVMEWQAPLLDSPSDTMESQASLMSHDSSCYTTEDQSLQSMPSTSGAALALKEALNEARGDSAARLGDREENMETDSQQTEPDVTHDDLQEDLGSNQGLPGDPSQQAQTLDKADAKKDDAANLGAQPSLPSTNPAEPKALVVPSTGGAGVIQISADPNSLQQQQQVLVQPALVGVGGGGEPQAALLPEGFIIQGSQILLQPTAQGHPQQQQQLVIQMPAGPVPGGTQQLLIQGPGVPGGTQQLLIQVPAQPPGAPQQQFVIQTGQPGQPQVVQAILQQQQVVVPPTSLALGAAQQPVETGLAPGAITAPSSVTPASSATTTTTAVGAATTATTTTGGGGINGSSGGGSTASAATTSTTTSATAGALLSKVSPVSPGEGSLDSNLSPQSLTKCVFQSQGPLFSSSSSSQALPVKNFTSNPPGRASTPSSSSAANAAATAAAGLAKSSSSVADASPSPAVDAKLGLGLPGLEACKGEGGPEVGPAGQPSSSSSSSGYHSRKPLLDEVKDDGEGDAAQSGFPSTAAVKCEPLKMEGDAKPAQAPNGGTAGSSCPDTKAGAIPRLTFDIKSEDVAEDSKFGGKLNGVEADLKPSVDSKLQLGAEGEGDRKRKARVPENGCSVNGMQDGARSGECKFLADNNNNGDDAGQCAAKKHRPSDGGGAAGGGGAICPKKKSEGKTNSAATTTAFGHHAAGSRGCDAMRLTPASDSGDGDVSCDSSSVSSVQDAFDKQHSSFYGIINAAATTTSTSVAASASAPSNAAVVNNNSSSSGHQSAPLQFGKDSKDNLALQLQQQQQQQRPPQSVSPKGGGSGAGATGVVGADKLVKARKRMRNNAGSADSRSSSSAGGAAPAEFVCEWANCKRCFDSSKAVYSHVYSSHVMSQSDGVCRWEGCDKLQRKKWSLVTHIQDQHCSEAALRAACQRRVQSAQMTPGSVVHTSVTPVQLQTPHLPPLQV